jgi:hypothetical protein
MKETLIIKMQCLDLPAWLLASRSLESLDFVSGLCEFMHTDYPDYFMKDYEVNEQDWSITVTLELRKKPAKVKVCNVMETMAMLRTNVN